MSNDQKHRASDYEQRRSQVRVLPSALQKALRIGLNCEGYLSFFTELPKETVKKGRKLLNYPIRSYPTVRIWLLRPNFYESMRFHINVGSAYFPCPDRQF